MSNNTRRFSIGALGIFVLAGWLIITNAMILFGISFEMAGPIMAIVGIVAGVMLLFGR
jgi:hypothetical protein